MINHLYKLKKPCPQTNMQIELTDDIKEWILQNRVYTPPPPPTPKKYNESFYQALLEQHLQGTHKSIPGIGVTDVTTDSLHAEIKGWGDWKAGLGQLMAYNHGLKRDKLAMYFFGARARDSTNVVRVLRDLDVDAFEMQVDENTHQHVRIMSMQPLLDGGVPELVGVMEVRA